MPRLCENVKYIRLALLTSLGEYGSLYRRL